MSADGKFYVPVSLQLWGVIEKTHIHINTHMNWVFHVQENKLLAAAVYPVRDHFQMVTPGADLTMHGPVRWFYRHSYDTLSNPDPRLAPTAPQSQQLLYYSILSVLLSSLLFALLYRFYLKPKVVSKMLKSD